MTDSKVFVVPRRSGSVSDVLEVIGAAYVLQSLSGISAEAVRLVQVGDRFQIVLPATAEPVLPIRPLIPFFKAKAQDQTTVRSGEVYDYAADKQKADEGKKQRDAAARAGTRRKPRALVTATEESEDRAQTSGRWPSFSALQSLTKGAFKNEWNGTFTDIERLDDPAAMAKFAWRAIAEPDLADDPPGFLSKRATLAQHFNPHAAKGGNRAKADSITRANLDGRAVCEWMKMVAFDHVAALRRAGDNFIRLWAPIPANVGLDALAAVAARFRRDPWRIGDVKQDVLAVIDVADELARHWLKTNRAPRRRAHSVVRGLETATFQDMGGGFVVMNISSLGLPGWIVLEDLAAVDLYLSVLDGFRRAAWSLDETHSDEVGVLVSMRDALGAEHAEPILAFLAEYSAVVQRRSGNQHERTPSRFSTGVLDAMFGGIDQMLSEIVKTDGFRNIATALRKGTVTEQYHKSQDRQVYEIHYGLFGILRRASRRPKDLVVALSDFLAKYDAENARALETGRHNGRARARVSDADLDALVALIDKHGPELIGSLLCAYGSAKEPWEDDKTTHGAAVATSSTGAQS